MTSPGPAFRECTGSYNENVHALEAVSSSMINWCSDCIGLDGDSCHLGTLSTILKHFTHTMKPSDPLLLAVVTLGCGMYPAGKVDISQHLATPGFHRSDHTVGDPSTDTGSLMTSSYPQMSAYHLLGLQVRAN